jgi:hypothetical protein
MKFNNHQKNISVSTKRKVKVFSFILVLTTIIWLLVELSKVSISTVTFNVDYNNAPANKLLQSKPISSIAINLKAPGFLLLKNKLKPQKLTLSLRNSTKKGAKYFILPKNQKAALNEQLPKEAEILAIVADSIFFDLGINKSKKVPVKASLDLKFKLGYNLIDSIKLFPDSVLVTGSEKIIDSIQELNTTPLQLENVFENINTNLALILPTKNEFFKASVNNVKVIAKVDKFTEGKFKVPVTIINKPNNVVINTFPREIEVVYQVGLSNFNKINPTSFLVVFDYEQYKKDTLIQYLTPVIQHKSDLIATLKVYPPQIEFLFQK